MVEKTPKQSTNSTKNSTNELQESAEPHPSDPESRQQQTNEQSTTNDTREQIPHQKFPVVTISASDIQCESLVQFFQTMPSDTGFAFVVCIHKVPPAKQWAKTDFAQLTTMPIVKFGKTGAEHQIAPNTVIIARPGCELAIDQGLLFVKNTNKRDVTHPIDQFLQSVAHDQQENAAVVFLTGSSSDCTRGLNTLKNQFGIVMCQDTLIPHQNSISLENFTNHNIDYVLPIEQMAARLISYFKSCTTITLDLEKQLIANPSKMAELIQLIAMRTGHDFSQYKQGSLMRRIGHRMNVRKYSSLPGYITFIKESTDETRLLFSSLLIGLTHFFRDSDAFKQLATGPVTTIINNHSGDAPIRIWVAACSTGEEAYSLAITLLEQSELLQKRVPIQIFATDVDEKALTFAREGKYPSSIKDELGTERLNRFFSQTADGSYQISTQVRGLVVFARHDLISDPPFINLDLLSCRNLLIYFNAKLQHRLIPLFHYCIKPGGILFLGSSESINYASRYFSTVDKHWKIFSRTELATAPDQRILTLPGSSTNHFNQLEDVEMTSPSEDEQKNLLQMVEAVLVHSGAAPAVIINKNADILYIHGRTGRYLEPTPGEAHMNLLYMAKSQIRPTLVTAINEINTNARGLAYPTIEINDEYGSTGLEITLRPIVQNGLRNATAIVIFKEFKLSKQVNDSNSAAESQPAKSAEELEKELQHTSRVLQSTIEELESSNEEMRATNEELQATNEELQSANEEIQSAKEELLSNNEEYETVNAELLTRISELSSINDDLQNFLDSTAIATIFLDIDLNIRRYTSTITSIAPLGPQDIGRPLSDIATNLIDYNISNIGHEVLTDLKVRDEKVESRNGDFYIIKVRPYRTVNQMVDGIVITFENITQLHQLSQVAIKSEAIFRTAFNMSHDACFLIQDLCYIDVNKSALELLKRTRKEVLETSCGKFSPELQPNGDNSVGVFQKHVKDAIKHGSTRFTWFIQDKNQHTCNVEWVLSTIEIDKQTIVYGIARSIK